MTIAHPSRVAVLLAIAAVSLGAVGAALVTQHVFDMQPCPWCVLQRLEFVTIGAVALVGLAWPSATGLRATLSGVVALSVAGMATALWHHFVAVSSTSCNVTLADRIVSATGLDDLLPGVFQARASCADAAVKLFGVPYQLWSLTIRDHGIRGVAVAARTLQRKLALSRASTAAPGHSSASARRFLSPSRLPRSDGWPSARSSPGPVGKIGAHCGRQYPTLARTGAVFDLFRPHCSARPAVAPRHLLR
jgi:protein dithiol:quinone oxidoreductase